MRIPSRRRAGRSLLVPAVVLRVHEGMKFGGQALQLFSGREPVGPGERISVLHLLQQPGDSHLNEFIEIAGGDGEELDSFQQRIAFVQSFFEHTPVESQPGLVAIEVVARIAKAGRAMGEDLLPEAW